MAESHGIYIITSCFRILLYLFYRRQANRPRSLWRKDLVERSTTNPWTPLSTVFIQRNRWKYERMDVFANRCTIRPNKLSRPSLLTVMCLATQLRSHVTSRRHRCLVPLRSPVYAPADRHMELSPLGIQFKLRCRHKRVPSRCCCLSLLCVKRFHLLVKVPRLLRGQKCARTQVRAQGSRIRLDWPHGLGKRSCVGQTKRITRHLN
jgi:hypothetical protein